MSVSPHDTLTTLHRLPLGWWLLAFGLFSCAQGLLVWRWRLYLGWLGASPPWQASLLVYLQGWALLFTPARSGEVVRVRLLGRRCGVPTAIGLAAMLAERCTGLTAALLLLGLGLAGSNRWALLAVAACAALLLWLFTHPKALARAQNRLPHSPQGPLAFLGRLIAMALRALAQCRQLLTSEALTIGIVLALGAWLLESCLVWSLWQAVGGPAESRPGLLAAAVVRVSLGMGAVLSLLPVGLGIADSTALGMALLVGVSTPLALTTLVVLRLFTVALPLAVGGLAWWVAPLGQTVQHKNQI